MKTLKHKQLIFQTCIHIPMPYSKSQEKFFQHPLGNQYQKMHSSVGFQNTDNFGNLNINSLCNQGHLKKALEVLYSMNKVDSDTYVCMLQTCANMRAVAEGRRVHAHLIKTGFEVDVNMGNQILIMYGKCGKFKDARRVFDKMSQRDLVTWTATIGVYAQNGEGEDALRLFKEMLIFGFMPNQFAFGSVVNVCAKLGSLEEAKQVHDYVIKTGYGTNPVVGSAFVDMYAKCGNMVDACKVFSEMPDQTVVAWTSMITGYVKNGRVEEASQLFWRMPERNVVSWNAMIAGYAQSGHDEEAVELFKQMRSLGNSPNQSTFPCVLSACGNMAALGKGKHVHGLVVKMVFKLSVFIANALMTMYAKCGSIDDARQIFNRTDERNVVTWNAMISGYAQNGEGKEAIKFFEQMQKEGMKPNHVTFLCVLCACNHGGLVVEGCHYFDSICQDHGIVPRADHYACMVDLLGRSGHLDEAENFIKNMPVEPDAGLWMTLLNACRIHGNSELGQKAADKVFELGAQYSSTYVLLSHIYAEAGRWDNVAKVRLMMREVKRTPGFSWIEVKNQVHRFVIGDRTHPQTEEIYAMLETLNRLMRKEGYASNFNSVMHNAED